MARASRERCTSISVSHEPIERGRDRQRGRSHRGAKRLGHHRGEDDRVRLEVRVLWRKNQGDGGSDFGEIRLAGETSLGIYA